MQLHEILAERKVVLSGGWPAETADDDVVGDGIDMFTKVLPTLLVASKADRSTDSADELAILEELARVDYPCISVSARTGAGFEELGEWLFERLGIVRVYTKTPGNDADMGRPYTLRSGSTVLDVATLVHRDIAANFTFARLWGAADFDAQQVGRDHIVQDGDILEIHT